MKVISDYRALKFWAGRIGEPNYYVALMGGHAEVDQAPLDAVYRSPDGSWIMLSEVENAAAIFQAHRSGML